MTVVLCAMLPRARHNNALVKVVGLPLLNVLRRQPMDHENTCRVVDTDGEQHTNDCRVRSHQLLKAEQLVVDLWRPRVRGTVATPMAELCCSVT